MVAVAAGNLADNSEAQTSLQKPQPNSNLFNKEHNKLMKWMWLCPRPIMESIEEDWLWILALEELDVAQYILLGDDPQ